MRISSLEMKRGSDGQHSPDAEGADRYGDERRDGGYTGAA
jgi:hypothetical protein